MYKKMLVTNEIRPIHSMSIYGSGPSRKEIVKPAVNFFCPICKSQQTYNMSNDFESDGLNFMGKIYEAVYRCAGCNANTRTFFVYISGKKDGDEMKMYMEKVGQYPSWTIELDKELENILGKHADFYKKGLINESQSYGIGAYAYFRRITEEIIDKLLDSITDLIEEKDREAYAEALEKTKKTRNTQEKIDLVKDLLPTSLKPEEMNPLGVLHSALSEGLHNGTDEECMEKAEIIRNILVFLVNRTIRMKSESSEFTDGMKKLLSKKANTAPEGTASVTPSTHGR